MKKDQGKDQSGHKLSLISTVVSMQGREQGWGSGYDDKGCCED